MYADATLSLCIYVSAYCPVVLVEKDPRAWENMNLILGQLNKRLMSSSKEKFPEGDYIYGSDAQCQR